MYVSDVLFDPTCEIPTYLGSVLVGLTHYCQVQLHTKIETRLGRDGLGSKMYLDCTQQYKYNEWMGSRRSGGFQARAECTYIGE